MGSHSFCIYAPAFICIHVIRHYYIGSIVFMGIGRTVGIVIGKYGAAEDIVLVVAAG